jgi:hypothetical protein
MRYVALIQAIYLILLNLLQLNAVLHGEMLHCCASEVLEITITEDHNHLHHNCKGICKKEESESSIPQNEMFPLLLKSEFQDNYLEDNTSNCGDQEGHCGSCNPFTCVKSHSPGYFFTFGSIQFSETIHKEEVSTNVYCLSSLQLFEIWHPPI